MKRSLLIVNADDYAMNEIMSASIRAAFSEGLISSSSCFATSTIFQEEIRKAFEAGIKTFGVHLDLSFGKPVSTAVGLNKFPERPAQTLTKEQIKSEFLSQIQKVLESGVQISHLDNHRDELYWEWEKFEVVYELAAMFSLPVRNPLGKNTRELARKLSQDEEKIKLIESLPRKHEKMRNKYGTRTTDYFYSLEHYREDPLKKIIQISETLECQKKSIELCVHLTHQLIASQSESQFISENDQYRKLFRKYCGTFADV